MRTKAIGVLAMVLSFGLATSVFAGTAVTVSETEQSGVVAAAANQAIAPESQNLPIETHIGGHIKLGIFDRVNGTSYYAPNQKFDLTKSYGVAFKEFDLYVSGKINEWLSFEVDPKFSASTGATPKIGVTWTAVATAPAFSGFSHGKAVVIFALPGEVEMEIGALHPIFTAEYGRELFWDDEINSGKFAANNNVGAVHDNGIQFYRNFDFGNISMPVYLYYLNGGSTDGFSDVNNEPGAMLHIEPTLGPLTLLGSIYGTRYDAAEKLAWTKWSAGGIFVWEGLTLRSEFVKGKQEKAISVSQDANSEGYYAKVLYKVLPWLQLMIHHETVLENASVPGKAAKYILNAPGAQIFLADSAILELAVDIADFRLTDNSKKVIYTRPSISMRITF